MMPLRLLFDLEINHLCVCVCSPVGEMMTETIETVKQSSPIVVENDSWKKQTGIDLIRKIHEVGATTSGSAPPSRTTTAGT